ncbi:MAG: DUF1501 domain-containing protein [Myxococcales bacterium]|nr:DUF1501 domain-containing protein [Myxococcales bacterium]
MSKNNVSRRGFLKTVGAGTGAVITAPYVWRQRAVSAAPLVDNISLTGGAIFFVLNGGARTQAVFNGTVGTGTNPFGSPVTASPDAVPVSLTVPLSSVMRGTRLDEVAINSKLNFISTAQHANRTGSHGTGRAIACTGYQPQEDKPGILTLLNQAFAFRDIPCINIGNDTPTTNIGSEISSTFAPIKISSALNVNDITSAIESVQVSDAEALRLNNLRYGMSDQFLRATSYSEPANVPFFQRIAADVAAQLDADALDIRTNASMGNYLDSTPVGNAALRASFGVQANGGGSSLGASAMLAVRLRQLGCAGVTVSTGNWDMHSNEMDNLPGRAFEVGQSIAGLVDHLSRIPDPVATGASLLDTTVITVLTDFNRGNWSVGTGFNSNNGSDHRGNEDKTSFQCIPMIGGGLPGGKILGEIGADGSPSNASPIYTTQQVLATVLDLLGLPSAAYFPGATPITQDLI